MADLRPDVPIAATACGVVVAILQYADKRGRLWLAVALILVSVLPLLHVTGVLALVFCGAFATILAVVPTSGGRTRRLELMAVVACGLLVFLFRQAILDALVPTRQPEAMELPFRDDLAFEIQRLFGMGIAHKLVVEARRWTDYFLVSNLVHLVFVGLGVTGLIMSVAREKNPRRKHLELALAGGVAVAFGVAICFDPSATSGHLVPLLCLAYIASGVGLYRVLTTSSSTFLRSGLVAFGVLLIVIKGAHAYALDRSNIVAGVSNRNVTGFLSNVFESGVAHEAVAPTFLWPYVDPLRSVVLIEPGSRIWEPTDLRWRSVTSVIVDRDLLGRGWDSFAQAMVRCGAFEPKGSIGQRGADIFYLQAYKVNRSPSECMRGTEISPRSHVAAGRDPRPQLTP
jgi:hypothetical protein